MKSELASKIDYTNLSSVATRKQIEDLCKVAKENQFRSVCVHPFYVKLAKELLNGTNVKICTVVGFPLGQNTTRTKIYETHDAIINGADEIDMVINIARLKGSDVRFCIDEINMIKRICKKRMLKVIVETCDLTPEELELSCQVVLESNADCIKTSTGFSKAGATIKDIQIMNAIIQGKKEIKASGGIKTKEQAFKLIKEGATIIGTSRNYWK